MRESAGARVVVDHRADAKPVAVLAALRQCGDVQVWAEGPDRAEVGGRARFELKPCTVLAVWSTPPGRGELLAALEQAQPETVHLFAFDHKINGLESFLGQLAGMVKHALRTSGGTASISALAAGCGQRRATVRAGLAWLAARGYVVVTQDDGEGISLAEGEGIAGADVQGATARLRALLAETAAYREHFRKADADTLL